MRREMRTHLTILAGVLAIQGCAMSGEDASVGADPASMSPTQDPPPTPAKRIGFVLAHGFTGGVDTFDPAIVAALTADGYAVLRDAVPPVDSVAVRAAALATQVDAFIADNQLDRVHVIAHSMGGLDTRFLISSLGYASKIASLTTMGTPHRGSPLADLALGITHSLTTSQEDALLAITKVLGPNVSGEQLQKALLDLAEASAPAFNHANPDAPSVAYYSYAGFSTLLGVHAPDGACKVAGSDVPDPGSLPGFLQLSGPIVGGLELRPNDGVVPVDSADWTGFVGCIPFAHTDLTGGSAELDGPLVPLYREIAARVAPL
jgi:triacylglycerol lipase